MSDAVAGRLRRHQLPVKGRERLWQRNDLTRLDDLRRQPLRSATLAPESKQPLHAHICR